MLLVVIGEQKINFSGRLKFEAITIYYLWFVVKVLWKYYEYSTFYGFFIKIGS